MSDSKSIKLRLDELIALHKQNYITENEFVTARRNVLLDAGLDITPRKPDEKGTYLHTSHAQRSKGGCGCFLGAILLFFALGVLFAVTPFHILERTPYIEKVVQNDRVRSLHNVVSGWIESGTHYLITQLDQLLQESQEEKSNTPQQNETASHPQVSPVEKPVLASKENSADETNVLFEVPESSDTESSTASYSPPPEKTR